MTDNLLPIFAEGGIGLRLLRAAEAYARDEYIFSPDEGSDHVPTDFEHMLFEDMINGLFAHEPFAAILQEAARAALPLQDGSAARIHELLTIAVMDFEGEHGRVLTNPNHWTTQARAILWPGLALLAEEQTPPGSDRDPEYLRQRMEHPDE